jgi:hypothetical protein
MGIDWINEIVLADEYGYGSWAQKFWVYWRNPW